MTRRIYGIASAAVVLIAAAGFGGYVAAGTTSDQTAETPPPTVSDPPKEVANAQPLAEAFYTNIVDYYPDARVFITQQGYIAMEFSPAADSGDGVKRELGEIALEYSRVVNDTGYNATTLSIVTGRVEAVAPEPSVEAHANGNLTDEAYSETIEVRAIERTDG